MSLAMIHDNLNGFIAALYMGNARTTKGIPFPMVWICPVGSPACFTPTTQHDPGIFDAMADEESSVTVDLKADSLFAQYKDKLNTDSMG